MAVDHPRVLRDSTNIVVRLAPAPVVARVSMTLGPARGLRSLEDEVAFAQHAVARGAPVVSPARDVAPGPQVEDGFAITLWEHVEVAGDVDAAAAGRGLRGLHDAVADFDRELPAFDRLDEADALVESLEPDAVGTEADLAALRAARDVARESLRGLEVEMRPIHGDAHLGNVLQSRRGPLWSDLENVCSGPVEYDVACLLWRERVHGTDVSAAVRAYGDYDSAVAEALFPVLGVFLTAWTIVVARRRPSLAAAPYVDDRLRYVRELAAAV